MGACDYINTLISCDIREDIANLSKSVVDMLEDSEDIPYSGGINTISFRRQYAKKLLTEDEKYNFIEDRLNELGKGEGEIVDLGVEYYVKAYVDFTESDIDFFKRKTKISKETLNFYYKKFSSDRKFLVVDETGSYYSSFKNMKEAKSFVNKRILNEKFSTDYFILSKSNIIFCTGIGDRYDRRIFPSSNYLVIPYHKYLLIGWARE